MPLHRGAHTSEIGSASHPFNTVPVYVAESVARKYRGNLVSLYQFNIALGEVFGYVVAAIFVNVKVGHPFSER